MKVDRLKGKKTLNVDSFLSELVKTAPTITLKTVSDYYSKQLLKSDKAVSFLKTYGLYSGELNRLGIGFSDGSIESISGESQKAELKNLGVFDNEEFFLNCITIPFLDELGQVVNIHGINIETLINISLNDRGVFNHKALKVYDEVILCDSAFAALCFLAHGFLNAVCSTDIKALLEHRIKTVILTFDDSKLKNKLLKEGINVKTKAVPEGGWIDYFKNPDVEEIKSSIAETIPVIPEHTNDITVKKTDTGIVFALDDIFYEIRTVKEIFISNLRVNIKAVNKDVKHFDSIDLFSSKQRRHFSNEAGAIFNIDPRKIEKHLIKILEYLEAERDRNLRKEIKEDVYMSDKDREIGLAFLKSENLFEEIIADLDALGYVGESVNKLLVYIVAVSRLLDNPLSILVISQSGAGKSLLIDCVRKLIPPSDVISLSSLSDMSLNYYDDFSHKFLILGESIHTDTIQHQIREIISSQQLSRLVTFKAEGRMKSEVITTKAIVSIALTTTSYKINAENLSRYFVVNADESKEQTERIHLLQREKYSLSRFQKQNTIPDIIHKHHIANKLLKRYDIINPYAHSLKFPANLLRTRRDNERFLDLIAAICFIRQYQKEIKVHNDLEYLECDSRDYEVAYRIMSGGLLSASQTELPKGAIDLYETLRKLVRKLAHNQGIEFHQVKFTQKEIRKETGFGQSWLQQNLKVLVGYEYIHVVKGGTERQKGHYSLKDDVPLEEIAILTLPKPDEIKTEYSA